MKVLIKGSILAVSLASCGGSKGGDSRNPPNGNVAIPEGEKEVFQFTDKSFGKADIRCSESGFGFALDEKMNKMVVCCVALSQAGVSSNTVKFITRDAEKISVKPERCDAVVVSGALGDTSLPVQFDLTGQKLVTLGANSDSMFSKTSGSISISGSPDLATKLVGQNPLYLSGAANLSHLHVLGTPVTYGLKEGSGVNNFIMSNVKIEGKDDLPGGLTLSTLGTTTSARAAMTMKFENVTVSAEKSGPVSLVGYPFDISGIEILAGKQFKPHLNLTGKYLDTTGVISEKRYPVVTSLQLNIHSSILVSAGVLIKIPVDAQSNSAFRSNGPVSLTLAGTPTERVTVVSNKDDSLGGDTNGDGNATKGGLARLIRTSDAATVTDTTLTVQNTDFKGVSIELATKNSKAWIGQSALAPAESGEYWRNPIRLVGAITTPRHPTLAFNGPVSFTLPVESYSAASGLSINAPVFADAWSNSFPESDDGSIVSGVDFITVLNTSTSANRLSQDVRILTKGAYGCKFIQDNNGQVTAEAKSTAYYVKNNEIKVCE